MDAPRILSLPSLIFSVPTFAEVEDDGELDECVVEIGMELRECCERDVDT